LGTEILSYLDLWNGTKLQDRAINAGRARASIPALATSCERRKREAMDSEFSKSSTEHKNAPVADNPMTNREAMNEFLGSAGRDNSALELNWRTIDSGG